MSEPAWECVCVTKLSASTSGDPSPLATDITDEPDSIHMYLTFLNHWEVNCLMSVTPTEESYVVDGLTVTAPTGVGVLAQLSISTSSSAVSEMSHQDQMPLP